MCALIIITQSEVLVLAFDQLSLNMYSICYVMVEKKNRDQQQKEVKV